MRLQSRRALSLSLSKFLLYKVCLTTVPNTICYSLKLFKIVPRLIGNGYEFMRARSNMHGPYSNLFPC